MFTFTFWCGLSTWDGHGSLSTSILASSNSDRDLDSWGLGTSSGKPQRKGFWDWGVDVAAGIPAPGEGAPRPCDKAGMIG